MSDDADVTELPSTASLLDAAVAALGGSRRAGQARMADAVTGAIDAERHLAVQAGTGTDRKSVV